MAVQDMSCTATGQTAEEASLSCQDLPEPCLLKRSGRHCEALVTQESGVKHQQRDNSDRGELSVCHVPGQVAVEEALCSKLCLSLWPHCGLAACFTVTSLFMGTSA